MKCPVCSATELVHDTRSLRYTCDGEATIIPAVVGDYCPTCGEGVIDAPESARVSAAMLAFRRSEPDELGSVDGQAGIAGGYAGTLDAHEINRLGLAWHGESLRDTERRYRTGHEQPRDWSVAKQELVRKRRE